MISIGFKVKGSPTPIAYYREDELEERVTCSACTMEYTIYGAFGSVPMAGFTTPCRSSARTLILC